MDSVRKIVGFITTPADRGTDIARALVEAKLAACVNIVPAIRSVYRWEGKVEDDEESLLIVKTTAGALPTLIEAVKAIHPYDTFELITMNIDAGNDPYLEWIENSVSVPPQNGE